MNPLEPSDHYDGSVFHNAQRIPHGLNDFLRWIATRQATPWAKTDRRQELVPSRPKPQSQQLIVTFVNHATTLIQVGGLNILTDPIWSERASPVSFLGPQRRNAPGIAFDDLPKIDLVLISHNHYDHMDRASIKRLEAVHAPLFITGIGNDRTLERMGVSRRSCLDWWQSLLLPSLGEVTFVPAQHFSGRGLLDRDRSLWGGFYLNTADYQILFAGDTGYGPHFKAIKNKLGEPDLALLPIGAYLPRWFMQPVHMSPDDAVKAHLDLGARRSMAIHFGTFQLADDGEFEPLQELKLALAKHRLPESLFWTPERGEAKSFDAGGAQFLQPRP